MLNKFLERKDRTRIEKLGSGLRKYSGLLLKFGFSLTYLIGGRRHANLYLSVTHFGRFLLEWKGSSASLVKYLKGCQILLMQAVSGTPGSDCRSLGVVVGQGLLGIPRLIPHRDRIRIVRGDVALLRLWLSLLGGYRIIETRVHKASFKTISQPGLDIKIPLAEFSAFLKKRTLGELGVSLLKRVPVPKLRFRPLALLTSGPNVPPNTGSLWTLAWDAKAIWRDRNSAWYKALEDYSLRTLNTKFLGLIRVYAGIPTPLITVDENGKLGETFPYSNVWERSLAVLISKTRRETDEGIDRQTSYLSLPSFSKCLRLGRLHAIPEPAGKVRVVAMVTWWVQCLLYPLHLYLFKLLGTIPQDGTHNQAKPLASLAAVIKKDLETTGHSYVYSFDLKAATDRIPIELQVSLLSNLLGGAVAKAWRTILVGIPYDTRPLKQRLGQGGASLKYAVGQPMGAYSSWAMLAMIHHFLVQYSAYKAGYQGWFPFYAVLGDDIVIRGKGVAKRYRETCETFGITIGLAKSLISSNGTFEYAKRFYYRGEDASPLSAREYWVALGSLPSFIELIQRAKSVNTQVRLSDAIRSYSKGYRVVGDLTKRLVDLGNTRSANFLAALFFPGGPFAKPLASLFSPTSTGIRQDENLVENPITERRVRSVSRSVGTSIKEIAGCHTKAQKTFLDEAAKRQLAVSTGTSDRLWSGMMEAGLAPFISVQRALQHVHVSRELQALENVGTYLLKGNLNSKRLITFLEKILPLWTYAMSDVASLPMPESLFPVEAVIRRPKLGRLLKLRVRLLGLAWKGRTTRSVRKSNNKVKATKSH
nr:MAG: putative RNA-dependent RNA polymerase [Mitoviridae sp.]